MWNKKAVEAPRPHIREKWIRSLNGNLIYMRISLPVLRREGKIPCLVFVPGGLGSGACHIDSDLCAVLAMEGYAVVGFNPQGRGSGDPGDIRSEGVEDFNGKVHQDDLRTVIDYLCVHMSELDRTNMGVVSWSFGISIASGCLARHHDLPVKFLIDVEGPSDSFVIMAEPWSLDDVSENDMAEDLFGIFRHRCTEKDPSPENVAWWREREALKFIGHVKCPYLRLQAEWDHMQPPSAEYQKGFDHPPVWYQNKHALDMVNAAIAGSSPWVRINGRDLGNRENTLYDRENQPVYYSGGFDFSSGEFIRIMVEAVRELSSRK